MKSKIIFFFFLIYFIFIQFSNASLLNPKGLISCEQKKIIFLSFYTMLIIVIPVIFMIILFTYKYNKNNINSKYTPNWNHSNKIECFFWFIPICIVLFLSILSWKSTHKLEPSNLIISNVPTIKIDVISLNKKWLFIYPDYKIAVINQIAFPSKNPVIFRVTSNSVMNSFFIPSLGSQIYAMAGMVNKLNLIANEPGLYKGFSANYNGLGFSNMKFDTIVTPDFESFQHWVKYIKEKFLKLNNLDNFKDLNTIDNNQGVEYFCFTNSNIFKNIVNNFNN